VSVLLVCACCVQLGLEPHHAVGLIGFNAPEWFVSNFGAIFAGYNQNYCVSDRVFLKLESPQSTRTARCAQLPAVQRPRPASHAHFPP